MMLSCPRNISVRPNSRSKCKAMITKTNINRPKKIAPIGVKKLRTRLLPVATLYKISIHLVLKAMILIPLRMEDFAVTCPLVPDVPHLRSGSCSSPCIFGLGFLQTPPRDDALALLLTFGSANTWCEDLHLASSVPCLAHTQKSGAARASTEFVKLIDFQFTTLCQIGSALAVT